MTTTNQWEDARRILAQAEAQLGVRPHHQDEKGGGAPSRPYGSTSGSHWRDRREAETDSRGHSLTQLSLRMGTVTEIVGATSILLALAGQAMGQESWCVVVGGADISFAAAADLGMDLSRVVSVPFPGAQYEATVAMAVEGFDVVVLGEEVKLSPRAQRGIAARVRVRNIALVTAGHWAHAETTIGVRRRLWHGPSRGCGAIEWGEIEITARGRHHPLPRREKVRLDTHGLTFVGGQALRQGSAQKTGDGDRSPFQANLPWQHLRHRYKEPA